MAGWPFGYEGNEIIANKIKAGVGSSDFVITRLQDELLAALALSAHEGLVKVEPGKNQSNIGDGFRWNKFQIFIV